MKQIKFRRSGDVNLHPLDKLPEGLKEVKFDGVEWILARGEATGSKHLLTVERPSTMRVFKDDNGRFYFALTEKAKSSHTSDHETTIVEHGFYVQTPEREIDHFVNSVVRKVRD